jgi:hypothetical protein
MDLANCSKQNKRRYQRCLKNFLNDLRQREGHIPFHTIAKYKKQFNVATPEQAYDIAEVVYEASKDKHSAHLFTNLSNMRDVFHTFMGSTVKAIYVIGGAVIQEHTYDIPADELLFVEWWNSKSWDWRVSAVSVFTEHGGEGDVYITKQMRLNHTLITQSYLENETRNCVFKPIIAHCERQLVNPEISLSQQSKFQTILNKVDKITKLYVGGVPDDQLDNVFKKLKIKMKLIIPFSNRVLEYGEQDKNKYVMSMSYINTRLNHLEIAGEYYNNNKPIVVGDDRFNEILADLITNKQFYLYQKRDELVYNIKTTENSYKLGDTKYDVFNEFEKEYELNNLYLDDIKDKLLSKFIRCGAHMTTTKINGKYKGKLNDYIDDFKEIDCIKAYTQFKKCKYYEGFVGKITDFRRTDKIEGIGFYIIGNIDWTKANKKLKKIQRVFDIYRGRNIFASAEIKFLRDNGATFKIKGGCWGVKIDFEFNAQMFEKGEGRIPNYSRWTGMKNARNNKNVFYLDTTDKEYAKHIMSECSDAYYDPNAGVVRFTTDREIQSHLSQISSYIYAYQRLNLIAQLMKMNISKIIRINTDGIKYLPHEFEKSDIFRHIEKPNLDGFVMEEREDGFITNINCCNKVDWIAFHLQFARTNYRTHYDNELFVGKGGGGKTHNNLIDNGLVRLLYVAPSYKLTRAKQLEYRGIDTEVLANIISPNRMPFVRRQYNTLIIDEASMISDEIRKFIFENYKQCKIIFCGDIGYQAEPVEGLEIDPTTFKHITEVCVNYRCKDPALETILESVRKAIKHKTTNIVKLLDGIKTITRTEMSAVYKVSDMILTHTHATRTEYDKIIKDEKYYITKSDDNYSRGEIHFEKPKTKNYEKTNAFTTHSVQGETFKQQIFIDKELIGNKKLLYTALSRAQYISQLYIVI